MRRALGGIAITLAMAGLLAACMPRGKPLTPEEAQVVAANLVQMEARVTQQLRDSLEARGLRPATAEEVVATLTGNTTSMSGGGGTFVTYYRADGTLKAQLVTLQGQYRSEGTWSVSDDGTRCVTVDDLRSHRVLDQWDGGAYFGVWDTVHETNCYQVHYGDDIEYWFRVSGPHHLDSGESDIIQGRAFYL